MTPYELLEEAKARFIVLYHDDEEELERLLYYSLGKFQDKAGSIASFRMEGGGGVGPLPPDCLEVSMVVDARGVYHDHITDGQNITVETFDNETAYPLTIHYFQNLRKWDGETNLPNGCVSLVLDYLIALIDIPNTERERGAALATGQQVELPSKQDLQARLDALELAMEEAKAIVMPVSVW